MLAGRRPSQVSRRAAASQSRSSKWDLVVRLWVEVNDDDESCLQRKSASATANFAKETLHPQRCAVRKTRGMSPPDKNKRKNHSPLP
jgi:hypothetical protein